jgi:hypothetical protein
MQVADHKWPQGVDLDGQDPFQIIEPCVKLEKRRL